MADGPHYGVATVDTAPPSLVEGQRDDLLRITVTNFGTAGPADLELTGLGLLLESAAGTPWNATGAASLLASLELFADSDQSGSFDAASDALVAAIFGPAPAPDGTLAWSLANSDPGDLRVAAGQARSYFVVAKFNPGASAQTPPTLRLTHLTDGPAATAARDSVSAQLLTMQPVANVAATTVTALANTAPTSSGLPDLLVFDPATPGSVSLFAAFQDAEDTPAQLTFAVTGNTNPALFSFVGLDPAKGTLALNYQPGVNGSAQLTVRAMDRSGQAVATTFKVTVARLQSYADWSALYFGADQVAGGSLQQDAAGLTNLAKYAFVLDPQKSGDVAGLPRLVGGGNSRLFTHLRPKHATDLTYHYEISPDLASWQPALPGLHFYANTTPLPEGRARVDLLLLVGWPKAFLRARAELSAGAPAGLIAAAAGGAPGASGGNSPAGPAAGAFPPTGTQPIHGTAIFPEQQAINRNARFANDVCVADFDGDGLPDLASASVQDDKIAWYRNLGGGNFSTEQIVTSALDEACRVQAVDFDGDGRLDLYAGAHGFNATGRLVWFRNLGNGSFGSQQNIATGTWLALYVHAIAAADLDRDGRQDALFTTLSFSGLPEDGRVAWHRNLGNGNFGPMQIISLDARAPNCVLAADLDEDTLLDVVWCSGDNRISWNRGNGDGTFGPLQLISSQAVNPLAIRVADLDLDGLPDLISAAAQDGTGQIAWYRNLGGAVFGPQTILSAAARGATAVTAADLNGDGFPEVIAAAALEDKVVWFDNLRGSFGPENRFSPPPTPPAKPATDGPVSLAVADLNGDGTNDVAVAAQIDGTADQSQPEISWYRNTGGQFALATADTAPATLGEGAAADLLRIAVTNRGLAGDHPARLQTLALLFESAPGIPLSTTEANALLDHLAIYADANGTGAFEPAADKLLHTALHFPLSAGRLTLAFGSSNAPEWQVPPGETRHFFVVCALTANAAAQSPSSFRVTHLTSGTPRTIVQDAQSGAALLLEPVASFTGALVGAQANQPPTSSGLPVVTVFDTITPTSVPLWPHFADAEDSEPQLSFAVAGNSNPGLFSFVGVNPATGTLLLHYRPGVRGAAQLTVRATDSLGKSVTASLLVQVQVVASLSDWLSLHFPGGAPGALGDPNLFSYAFALDPRHAGDLAGLPRLAAQGQARFLSHRRPRYAADLAYAYEISADLLTWRSAVNGLDYFPFITDLPDAQQQVDLILLTPAPKAFLRTRPQVLP